MLGRSALLRRRVACQWSEGVLFQPSPYPLVFPLFGYPPSSPFLHFVGKFAIHTCRPCFRCRVIFPCGLYRSYSGAS